MLQDSTFVMGSSTALLDGDFSGRDPRVRRGIPADELKRVGLTSHPLPDSGLRSSFRSSHAFIRVREGRARVVVRREVSHDLRRCYGRLFVHELSRLLACPESLFPARRVAPNAACACLLASRATESWSVVTEEAAWEPRGWFGVATLTNASDPYADVAPYSDARVAAGAGPRMWLAGGGYMGRKGNSIVHGMVGYVDMWFSTDGLTWHQASSQRRNTALELVEAAGGSRGRGIPANAAWCTRRYRRPMNAFWILRPTGNR